MALSQRIRKSRLNIAIGYGGISVSFKGGFILCIDLGLQDLYLETLPLVTRVLVPVSLKCMMVRKRQFIICLKNLVELSVDGQ